MYLTTTEPTATTRKGKLAQVCNATNRIFDVTYAGMSGGNLGFISIGTLGRFDDMYVERNSTGLVPADQVSVAASALFRTIYPFST